MPAFLIPLLGIGKSVIAWLSRRSLAELAVIALALLCVVQFLALKSEKRHSTKLQAQVVKLDGQLKAISAKKNEQKQVTGGNIAKAQEGQKRAESIAKRIETAPLSGNCKTPKEILDADI
jgi:predicted Holliday junction resolvase-like endonuclease